MRQFLIVGAATLILAACQSEPAPQYPDVTIYPAKAVVTMQSQEDNAASAVAVEDGKIIGIGNLESLTAEFSGSQINETFKDKTILPGLIDPHMHVLLGGLFYAQPFAPPWPMAMPPTEVEGGMTEGYDNRSEFLGRLKEIVAETPESQKVILVYGYHNLVQGPLVRQVLDEISPDRPLIIWHYSGHDFYLNSAAIKFVGATPALAEKFHGVDLDKSGALTGRIYEDAVFSVFDTIAPHVFRPQDIARGLSKYFAIMRNSGITTTADLGYGIFGRTNENATIGGLWSKDKNAFNLYLIPEHRAFTREFGEDAPNVIKKLVRGEMAAPAPVLPRVKFFTDGAFYSQTMRLSAPGYLAGQSKGTQGLWVTQPGELYGTMKPYLDVGLSAHVHSNGDAAQTETLNAFAQARSHGMDNDFVVEHGGLYSEAHTTLAADNDVMLSAASHYVHYMGEAYEDPLGPERAHRISPLGELSRKGAKVTIHSDAPLAPPDPLLAAGRHITRATLSGDSYAAEQALTPYDALEAITLDAATILGLEGNIGSIEIGKTADFTILDANPLDLDAKNWDEIGIWGVVLDGELRPIE